jgi:hypothetical protein
LKGEVNGLYMRASISMSGGSEAWRNLGISSVDLDPVHRFAQPGIRPRDLFPGRIVLDIVKPPDKSDKDRKEFMAEQNRHLAREVDSASHSPQRVCIVTDTSTPPPSSPIGRGLPCLAGG